MARHEGDLEAGKGAPLTLDELLAVLGRPAPAADSSKEGARACFLSASEGWNEALKQLGGAFAEDIGALNPAEKEE